MTQYTVTVQEDFPHLDYSRLSSIKDWIADLESRIGTMQTHYISFNNRVQYMLTKEMVDTGIFVMMSYDYSDGDDKHPVFMMKRPMTDTERDEYDVKHGGRNAS